MVKFNSLLLVFLALYGLQWGAMALLEWINREHLRRYGNRVPPSFCGFIDAAKLAQITAYTLENSRFGVLVQSLAGILLLALILAGVLPAVVQLMEGWQFPAIGKGLLFLLVPGILTGLVELPCDYYHTFVIEAKYGFNRSTPRMWLVDQVKYLLLSGTLFALLLSLVLWFIQVFPYSWWWWGFVAVLLIQLLLVVLYPVLIAPLFNKFEPLGDVRLVAQATNLMEAAGIQVSAILQMDAGRRSRHTNAYFTGLGKSKRIVCYDTLLQSHPHDEVLAVLAHEAGHYRLRHVVKQLCGVSLSLLAGFYATCRLLSWPLLYSTFGFVTSPPYAGLFVIGIFWRKLGFFVKPLFMALSRRFEREADRFALQRLGAVGPMVTCFKRLAADNLANLTPHPFYVWFYYSHPPLVDRVAWLEKEGHGKESSGNFQETPLC
jgi:STE24 endopeptidase